MGDPCPPHQDPYPQIPVDPPKSCREYFSRSVSARCDGTCFSFVPVPVLRTTNILRLLRTLDDIQNTCSAAFDLGNHVLDRDRQNRLICLQLVDLHQPTQTVLCAKALDCEWCIHHTFIPNAFLILRKSRTCIFSSYTERTTLTKTSPHVGSITRLDNYQ